MRRARVASTMAAMSVRLIDRLIFLDASDPAEAVPRPAPAPAPFWYANPLAWIALAVVAGYQRIVPDERKRACRFTPSCSAYMQASIRKYGVWNGGRRGLHRLRRCTGFVRGGEDLP